MATDSINSPSSPQKRNADSQPLTATEIVHAILTPLSSLKLTVALLFLSVLVTFLITLQQSNRDMWEIKNEHFGALFVQIPFQSIVVERWFPDSPPIPGSFFIPSGFTLIVLLLVNLTSAHLLRFRLQATGKRLLGGLVLTVAGLLFTWAIIFNTQSATTFQADPPIPYRQMWLLLQGILGVLLAAGVVGCFTLAKGKKVEKLLMASLTLIVAIALGAIILLGEKAFIGNEGMRIVWQLSQATAAALICLVASVLLFRRKGGMVLLHLGIAGLLGNEIYVSMTNEETQMQIVEGETVHVASDVRATEIAIIDQSDSEYDEIVVIPENQFLNQDKIQDASLPFNIEILKYIENASVVRKLPGQATSIAVDGFFQNYTAVERIKGNGVSSDQGVDLAAAYVRLTEKTTLKPLGTYLISQQAYLSDLLDSVTVGGNDYQIGLRYKTDYKPYSLTLNDVQAVNYVGTETPKWYSSDFVLNDRTAQIKSQQRIFMNNPLRYAGETFYQTGYTKDPRTGKEVSTLQIVKNKGWMIPYVCCQFVVVGLVAQFGMSLLGFLEKKQKQIVAKESDHQPALRSTWKASAVAIVLVAIFGLSPVKDLSSAIFGKIEHADMRLDLLAQVPVTFGGRVQPLDSLAKNTLRTLTKREFVSDANNDRQPAIKWLADTIFSAQQVGQYRLVRIEDLNVINALELPQKFGTELESQYEALAAQSDPEKKKAIEAEINRELKRPSLRYTLNELAGARSKIRQLIPQAMDPKAYSLLQTRLAEVAGKIAKVQAIQAAFGGIHHDNPDLNFEQRINLALDSTRSGLPLVLPTSTDQISGGAWQTFASHLDRQWVQTLAKKHDVSSYAALAEKIVSVDMRPELEDLLLSRTVAAQIVRDPKMLKVLQKTYDTEDPDVLASKVAGQWEQMPQAMKDDFRKRFQSLIDVQLSSQVAPMTASLAGQLEKIGGLANSDDPESLGYATLFAKLGPAYRAGDAPAFNGALQEYLNKLSAVPPGDYVGNKISAELIYNGSHFFHNAMIIFLSAFLVATFGWIGYAAKFNQAAFWMLGLGWALLVIGLVLRVYISGRPPVTNLYSSVLFVTAIFVPLMMLVERMTALSIGNVLGGTGAFLALLWAWVMSVTDGDTFTVLMAVLDTQFWLATHVVCVTIGYGTTFAAGAVGIAYVLGALLTPAFTKDNRRTVYNVMYGMVCLALLFSFFGTVLGGLWGDDSWGRFWGWDPKENGALMIVLWNAISLHARWGGLVKERGFAMIVIFGNIITLWSWKGVNVLGVGLHAYGASGDKTVDVILAVGLFHLAVLLIGGLPTRWWMSYSAKIAD